MKIAFLGTLDAILRRGSFAAAAHEIGLTPSAVSLQIKGLEEYFGQPLFDRSARTARPTPFARELSSNIQGALAAIDALRDKRSPTVAGRIALGTIRSVQTTTLPATLLKLRALHSQLEVRLVQEDSAGKTRPTRQIAFVCRAAETDNRRVTAIREAFEHVYATTALVSGDE